MTVKFDAFLDWAKNHFDNIKADGREIKLNSIFADQDKKNHLWCSPDGGKKNIDHGVYHCWKTDRKGTLVGLVMHVEKCSYHQAIQILNGGKIDLTKDISFEEEMPEEEPVVSPDKILSLPEHSIKINNAPPYWKKLASEYLTQRKMPVEFFYVCVDGHYKNRIIIPYYNHLGQLIYFNARALKKSSLKYLGPPKDIGVSKSEVLFYPSIPLEKNKIHITEGEFDAMTLKLCGLDAAACGGKALSDRQALRLLNHPVCLCLDTDQAGEHAIRSMTHKLKTYGKANSVTVARPAVGYKDWNEMLLSLNPKIIKAYIAKNEKSADEILELI